METHTRSAAAELFVPLPALMPSALMRGSLCAPFPPAHNPQEEPSAPSPSPAAPSRCIQSGPRYPRVASAAAAAHTAPCLTLILFSSLYRHAAAVQGRISGAAALPTGQRMETGGVKRCPRPRVRCSPLWLTPRGCCSPVRDVRRNGIGGTETLRGGWGGARGRRQGARDGRRASDQDFQNNSTCHLSLH